jgi:membrane protease YdiL (CAAX protease family)
VNTRARAPRPIPLALIATIAVGAIALAIRVPGTIGAVIVTALAGVVGSSVRLNAVGPPRVDLPAAAGGDSRRPAIALPWWGVVLMGCAAFAGARALGTVHPGPIWWPAVASNVVAAVAEEAFFRRLVYGTLAPLGPLAAVGGAAVLFGVVHVPTYGVGVLPIDFAAGIVLGWQRWASGGWSAPAVTHVAANLLGMGW